MTGSAQTSAAGKVWVIHAGALGDFVLTWPLLRALARGLAESGPLAVVADAGKSRLAAAHLGPPNVAAIDGNQRRFTRLWTGDPPAREDVQPGVDRVISFVADDSTEAGRRWLRSAALMFPRAEIEAVGPPGSASRSQAWCRHRAADLGGVKARRERDGPIVMHVGAGSREKAWPMVLWTSLVAGGHIGEGPMPIAGEAEAERFDRDERALFRSLGGLTILTLEGLADTLLRARLFIGADSGPAHLAAQLGVPTLALFGPTDPRIWSPVGPRVTVLAPPAPAPITWLTTERVGAAVRAALPARGAGRACQFGAQPHA